jgi:Skp family chaperone for outer membrane proteins
MMTHASSISISARASKVLLALALCLPLTLAVAQAQDANAAAPAAVAPAAASAKAGSGRIAVVDLQYLVANSKGGKSIRDQLEGQRKSYGAQIDKQEAALRDEEKALVAQKGTLSKDDFDKKGKAFQEKVAAAQKEVQQRRIAFDKAYADAMEKLRENIVKIVADIAGKNEIALVLNRQEVVLVDAKMDLTKEVLTALDAKVTSIPVESATK